MTYYKLPIINYPIMDKLFIPVILGTNRKDRQSEHVAKWVFSKMQENAELETQFFDHEHQHRRNHDASADDQIHERLPEQEHIVDALPAERGWQSPSETSLSPSRRELRSVMGDLDSSL